jgi:YVTN family beta-propeller protein
MLFTLLAVLTILTFPSNSQANVYGYIPNSVDLAVIDTTTNTVVTPIDLGGNPVGIATGPSGRYVYVTSTTLNTVSQIDLSGSNSITHNVGSPVGVAVSPDGIYVYVTSQNDTLTIIDTSDNSIYPLTGVGTSLYGVAVSPSGNFVYLTDDTANLLHVVDVTDPTNRMVVASPAVGAGPKGVAVSPYGLRVVVANSGDNTVSVITAGIYTVSATITVGTSILANPFGVAIANNGLTAYVTNSGDNSVSRIDLATSNVTDIPLAAGDGPQGVELNAFGNLVYVANNTSGTVKVINVIDDTVSATEFNIGNAPVALGKFFFPIAPTGLTATLVGDLDISLSWSGNFASVTGFIIERKKYSLGVFSEIATVAADVTTYYDPGLDYYANYYYRVKAYNADGNTIYSNVAFAQTAREQFSSSCFIATAAYGSIMEPQVQLLREFRDRFLSVNRAGQAFLNFYYENSPPIAQYIANHELLRLLVRFCLLPLLALSWLSLQIGLLPALLITASLATTLCLASFALLKRQDKAILPTR